MGKKVSYFKIAGFTIEIIFHPGIIPQQQNNTQIFIEGMFEGFLINRPASKPDYTIEFYHQKLFNLIVKTNNTFLLISKKNKGVIKTYYHVSISQFIYIISRVINQLLTKKGFSIHASAVSKNNHVFIFTGKSGAGKSTVLELLKKDYYGLSDDIVIIRKMNDRFFLYQYPEKEKADWLNKTKQRYQISKIFFLIQSPTSKVEKIKNKNQILKKIIKQLWIDAPNKNQLKLLFEFVVRNDFYYLYFSKNIGEVSEVLKKEANF